MASIRQGLSRMEHPSVESEKTRPAEWHLEEVYGKPAAGGRNVVLRATGRNGGAFAVKANVRTELNTGQFAAQEALRAVMADSVSPLYLDPEGRFFIMDWCPAPLLIARMHDPDRRACIGRAGAWLRRLHRRTRLFGPRRDADLLAFHLPAGENDDRDLNLAAAQLQARHAQLGSLRGPTAMVHGDFQLQNLFDLGGELAAFDRPRHRLGSPYFDVARFCLGLELHRALAAEDGLPWPDDLAADRRAFYEGYGAIPERHLPLHDLVEDLLILRNWHHFKRRPNDSDCRRKARHLRTALVRRGLLEEGQGATRRPGRFSRRLLRRSLWTEDAAPMVGR